MADLSGEYLTPQYFLRQRIGEGGMADVYEAWDSQRHATMAVKVLRLPTNLDPAYMERFRQEADFLETLRHPKIVRFYEYVELGATRFLVMEWVDGEDLLKRLGRERKALALEECLPIIEPICAALNYAHELGVFHCDVKPANIMLHKIGTVMLTDFGIAQNLTGAHGGGTPAYMAPEQFRREAITRQTDVYSLGLTLYLMLSGALPFTGASPDSRGSDSRERIEWEHLNRAVPAPSRFNPALPRSVEKVILCALAKRPEHRFSTTLELYNALQQASRGETPHFPASLHSTRYDMGIADGADGDAFGESPPQPAISPLPIRSFPLPPHQPSRSPRLFARTGEAAGNLIDLPMGEVSVGRSPENDLVVQVETVSRFHAVITCTPYGASITDLKSTVGTFINGNAIPPDQAIALRGGDIIAFGDSAEFEYVPPGS